MWLTRGEGSTLGGQLTFLLVEIGVGGFERMQDWTKAKVDAWEGRDGWNHGNHSFNQNK